MNKRTLFIRLAAASGYTGIGMLLGYSFSDHTINTALWIGLLLVIAAALLTGMYISARNETKTAKPIMPRNNDDTPETPNL